MAEVDRPVPEDGLQLGHGPCLRQQPDGRLRIPRHAEAGRIPEFHTGGARLVDQPRQRCSPVVRRRGFRFTRVRGRRCDRGHGSTADRGRPTPHVRCLCLRRRAGREGLLRRRRRHHLRQPPDADRETSRDREVRDRCGGHVVDGAGDGQGLAGQSRHARRLPVLQGPGRGTVAGLSADRLPCRLASQGLHTLDGF